MPADSPSSADRPTVLVVQPDERSVLDRFGDWMAGAGLAWRIVRPFAGEPVPQRVDGHGLLVLGGRMSANDDHEHPWLADVRRLLREAVAESCPTLGVCLGGQLLARALGGSVAIGDRGVEAGVARIHLRPEAEDDPLFANLPSPLLAASMHGDMISALPPGAAWLAHSEMYPHQAFRAAPRAWGVQFHPEISLGVYRRWREFAHDLDPETLERTRTGEREFEQLDDQVAEHCRQLAMRCSGQVRARWEESAAARA